MEIVYLEKQKSRETLLKVFMLYSHLNARAIFQCSMFLLTILL